MQVIKQCSLKKRIMTRSQGFIQIFYFQSTPHNVPPLLVFNRLVPVAFSKLSRAIRPSVSKMPRRFNGITTEKAKNNKYIVLSEL